MMRFHLGQVYAMPAESRWVNICIYSPGPSEPVAIPPLRHDGCAPFEVTVLGVADPGAPQVRVTHELPHLVGSAAETDVRENLVEILKLRLPASLLHDATILSKTAKLESLHHTRDYNKRRLAGVTIAYLGPQHPTPKSSYLAPNVPGTANIKSLVSVP